MHLLHCHVHAVQLHSMSVPSNLKSANIKKSTFWPILPDLMLAKFSRYMVSPTSVTYLVFYELTDTRNSTHVNVMLREQEINP